MLVLSRKKGEKLIFGENIIVEVLSIDGDRVSIGIDAPREIRVYRKELLDETASINKSATRVPPVSFQNAQPATDAQTALDTAPSVEKGSAENTALDAAENTAPHAGENTAPDAAKNTAPDAAENTAPDAAPKLTT